MTALTRIIVTAAALLAIALLGRATSAARLPTASGTTVTTAESWRLGVTSEDNAAYAALNGRPASIAASFRSNRGVTESYFIFPPAGRAVTVQSAGFHILRRSGTYTGTASLALEARSYDGTLQRTISAAPVDLQAAAAGVWTELALAPDPASLSLVSGEHLAFHFHLDGASSGDLDVRPVFEVAVTTDPGSLPTATPTATATALPGSARGSGRSGEASRSTGRPVAGSLSTLRKRRVRRPPEPGSEGPARSRSTSVRFSLSEE